MTLHIGERVFQYDSIIATHKRQAFLFGTYKNLKTKNNLQTKENVYKAYL